MPFPIHLLLPVFLIPFPSPSPSPSSSPCAPRETAVVVDTRAHALHLCNAGKIDGTFAVALGIKGVGKERQGDNRTPLGSYGLGPPRASKSFHIFVPVGYPTPAQARMGFTGSAIGIHGPPRGYSTLAELAMLVSQDWTAGCIAVATDAEIEKVAAWVRAQEVKDVRLAF
jgi:L,D-peptidoglycan transpeptidase YkuD (ErfK/YbiS/YcfS/YnhG family)